MFINVRHKLSNEFDFSQQQQIFNTGTSPIMQNISKKTKPHYTQKYNNSLNEPSFAQQLRKKPTSIEVFQCKNLSYHHHSSH